MMHDASIKARLASPYLNGQGIGDYLFWLLRNHPELHAMLDLARCTEFEHLLPALNAASWEFEADAQGGRGLAYNKAQRQTGNRAIGMGALLRCFGVGDRPPGPRFNLLDVLGGDGTLARFCSGQAEPHPTIITADISRLMIEACLAQGLACLRQSASRSLIADDVLDGVLIAYGSHHLTGMERPHAVAEAWRTLRPGGRLVLHDFETGGASARWFEEVVDRYSRTGHAYPHFSRPEMHELLREAGFVAVRVFELDDPFTLVGNTPQGAWLNAIMHLYEMYDLVKLAADPVRELEPLIQDLLGPITVTPDGSQFVARIERKALVAVGAKPGIDHPG